MKNTVHCKRCGEIVHIYRNPFLTVDIIIEFRDGRVVLVERKNPPYGWALPGGFVDYGESLEEAALREAFEETGLRLEKITQFRAYSDPSRDPRHHTVTVVFIGEVLDEESAILRPADDAKNCALFSLDGLPEVIAFDHRKILSDYRKWRIRNFTRF